MVEHVQRLAAGVRGADGDIPKPHEVFAVVPLKQEEVP
jgi:hypothetical protein